MSSFCGNFCGTKVTGKPEKKICFYIFAKGNTNTVYKSMHLHRSKLHNPTYFLPNKYVMLTAIEVEPRLIAVLGTYDSL